MPDESFKMKNIFDNIAQLCSFVIRNSTDDTVFVRYSCISPEARNSCLIKIREALPEIFITEGCGGDPRVNKTCEERVDEARADENILRLGSDDLTDEFYRSFEAFSKRICGEKDMFLMITLLQVLDEALAGILLEKIDEFQNDSFSVVLNTNRETTGVGLLPRCSCIWERSHRLSHSYNRLDNFLFNILLMENSILGELIDKHYFLKKETFPSFAENRKLTVATSPLCLDRHFHMEGYEKDGVRCFRVIYPEMDYSSDNEIIWRKIVKAGEGQCDIIVFPELLGNPQTTDHIRRKLKELDDERRARMPSLIILPSVWEKNRNYVTVLDRSGNVICRQDKQNPFRDERDGGAWLEGIRSNLVANIFHYEGIGRIAIMICKDFLTTSYMEQLMRCFKLTLIIVPSFSTGSYDFRQSFDVCAHDDCNVVWINSCAAMEKGKEANFENIGYVRKRVGRNDDDSQKLCPMPICEGAFEGKCRNDCIYFETIQGV